MFETTIAGSLPKPFWLAETQKLWPQWKAQGAELAAAKRDATVLVLKEQEDAGLDIVTDGEQSRQHFVHGFLEAVAGIDFEHKVKMGIRDNRYEAMVPQVTGAADAALTRAPIGSDTGARTHEEKTEDHTARPADDRRYRGRSLLRRSSLDGNGVRRSAERRSTRAAGRRRRRRSSSTSPRSTFTRPRSTTGESRRSNARRRADLHDRGSHLLWLWHPGQHRLEEESRRRVAAVRANLPGAGAKLDQAGFARMRQFARARRN